ncbi:retrovirus-related pol polyprotein from transposon TNT 1-94 [Tanacetum coccineum]
MEITSVTLVRNKCLHGKDDGDGLYVRGRSDHQGNQGRGSSRSKSKGKGTNKLKCYICYSEDHLKKDCLKRNKKKSTGFVKKNARQGSGMHYEGYDNGDLLMVVSVERFLEWIIDSGGSYHLTPKRDFLLDLKSSMVVRFFSVIIEHVPSGGQGRNLISLGTLDREGYTVKLQNGRVKVIKGSLMVLSRTMKGNCVYSLDGWAESGEASVGIQENESLAQVWHKRLGHISEAGLHELEKREVIGNKGLGKFKFFKNYVLGKSTRVSFGRGQHTKERVIDYVHADLWGPSRVESMSGCRYFLSIVDDYSRRFWVQFLRHKNEAFSKFKEWKCLLIQSGLPDLFWAEATVMTTYLINRSSSTALEKKTPMDLWSGHLTNYEMLRIFGCVAYSHIMEDTLKGAGAADSGKEVEFEVELQGSRVEPAVDPPTGENPWNEDEEQDKGPQQQNLDNYVLVRDRAKRTTAIPVRYRDEGNVSLSRPSGSRVEDDMSAYSFAIAEEEDTHKPITFQEAINSSEKDEWRAGIDYDEVLSLVVRHTSIRVILSLTAYEDYELEQLDVKTAFLHGNLEETIYIRQPPGFEEVTGNKWIMESRSLCHWEHTSRPNIAYAVSVVRRYLANPSNNQWEAVKWILKYLKSTADVGLVYGKDQGKHANVDGFVDADYAKDPNKGRSITGYVFMVEFMALTKAVKESIWLKGLLIELGVILRSVVLNCDNQGAIHLSRNTMFHERTKHINVRYHFIREIVESKEIKVAKIGMKDNAADTYIKVQVQSLSIA